MKRCALLLKNRYLGSLEAEHGIYRFSYSDEWRNSGFPLCPSMPFFEQPFKAKSLFPIFLDGSPDAWGKRVLQRAEFLSATLAKRSPVMLDDFDMFFRADDATRTGAINLAVPHNADILSLETFDVAPLRSLATLCLDFESMKDFSGNANVILDMVKRGISSGGARPKFNVRVGEDLWLCKCGSSEDAFHEPGWEAVNLELARLSGLHVPEFDYCQDLNILLVKRFDRKGKEKIHYASARTMLNAEESSYLEIARLCNGTEKTECFRRMVLNALVGNYDDHLRNHGFLFTDGEWHLSPLFDVQCILVDKAASFHATLLPDGNAFSNVQSILSKPEAFGLSECEACKIVFEMHETVKENVRRLAEEKGLTNEMPFLEGNYAKLDEEIARLPKNGFCPTI